MFCVNKKKTLYIFSVVVYVLIVVLVRRVPVPRPVGMLIIQFVIHVINNGIKDFRVQYVIGLIVLLPIEKWLNAVFAISKFLFLKII